MNGHLHTHCGSRGLNHAIYIQLGLAIYRYLCTKVGYVISGRVPGHPNHLGLYKMETRFFSEIEIYHNHKFTQTKIQFL